MNGGRNYNGNITIKCGLVELEDGRKIIWGHNTWRYISIDDCNTCNLRFKCWTAKELEVGEDGR